MKRETVVRELFRPRSLTLSAETWQAAAVLAGLRVAVNDKKRREDRDRGRHKNWLADIWGTIGELVALRRLNLIEGLPVRHHPIDFVGFVDDVDLFASASDGPMRLEAKAHLLESGKEWFMVNERARQRSTLRRAVGYLPVLSALGAGKAMVGRPIRRSEVQVWGPPDKPLRDPAVAITLESLASRYFAQSLTQIAAFVDADVLVGRTELEAIAEGAGQDLGRWRRSLPPLEDLPAANVVEIVQQLL